ncbi:hypothetical protein ACFY1P_02855 [Streptomyces sp. NPDC001407]|uniref:hypothetical protein n=1 Tax=Streptomyces sp. NPDC001407 TaxID=3364573 RepID=UPI00367ECD7F
MKAISATVPLHPTGEVQKIFGTVEITISEPFASYPDLTPEEREAILRAGVTAIRGALPTDLESLFPSLRVAEDRTL